MENKSDVVEKRIKPGIIRRRAAQKPAEESAPTETVSTVSKVEPPLPPVTPSPKISEVPEISEPVVIRAKTVVEAEPPPSPPVSEEAKPEAAPVKEAPASPIKVESKTQSKVQGPRVLPEGPPIGTIIKLPGTKKKMEGTPSTSGKQVQAEAPAFPVGGEEEEEKKLKAKKGAKKPKVEEQDFGLEGIGRVSTLSQIARISTHNVADRIFQPIRTAKRKKSKGGGRVVRRQEVAPMRASKRVVKMGESIVLSELAQQLGVKGSELVRKLMDMGTMVTLNQSIDFETANILAHDYQWEIKKTGFEEENLLKTEEDHPEDLILRAPVVTVMGHVDHGKTSLLDAIRKTQVAEGEHGGITQHIGAYRVKLGEGKEVTFLDTPGHEAFTAMRSRGAAVTDIVVLVVAADDGAMPQTIEAIHHAQAAKVPIIVAVNKIDKPEAKPDVIRRQLSEHGLLAEDWGGQTIFVNVSAKTKQGIPELLELLFLQAEILELKSNPKKLAKGTIVEARLDKGRGPVATVLVQEGTLRVGDTVVAGTAMGKVRAMIDDRGNLVQEAGPSVPVEILGLDTVPVASEPLQAIKEDKVAREIIDHRMQKAREKKIALDSKMSLEDLFSKMKAGEAKELNLIVKADVHGSVEALRESIEKLSTAKVAVRILHDGVGAITESDVLLASASNAVIIGFHVRPDNKAREVAEREGVEIKIYQIIYDAIREIEMAMEGLLEPTFKEKYLGRAEIRQVFNISKKGNVGGAYVTDGKIVANAQIRLLRDHVTIYEGKLSSLKRFKDDVREVAQNYECGMQIEGFNDIKEGDVIECFTLESVRQKLNS